MKCVNIVEIIQVVMLSVMISMSYCVRSEMCVDYCEGRWCYDYMSL